MNLDGYAKLPSKKTTFDFHSYQQWLSTCFPQHSSIKQLCMKHQAGLTPLPWPRSATGEAITAPMSETWEAQLRWMGSAHCPLLTPLIFPLHSPGPLALKIAGRIAEFFPGAVLIMVRLGFGGGGWKESRKGEP